MKIQVKKGIKVQPLSKYATDKERSEYNAKLRNLGRKKANRKKLIAFFNGTLMGDGCSKYAKMIIRDRKWLDSINEAINNLSNNKKGE